MSDRDILGPADVSDATLLGYAASTLGVDASLATLTASSAEVVDYDLDAITTGGRWWVTADVALAEGPRSVRFFVKLVQSWSRSPHFAAVPPEMRDAAEWSVPWRTEPLVYGSDLAERLPSGLTMAPVVDVRAVDELSSVVWLEEVQTADRAWDATELSGAARLLGRLAASPRVRPLSSIGETDGCRDVRTYVRGRLGAQVAPLIRSDELWQHPALRRCFPADLRVRLLHHLDRVDDYVAWLDSVPQGTAHGDACTNNLLPQRGRADLVLIDFGFWGTKPLGFDLSQLLLGDVQIGRRPASDLVRLEPACLDAYVAGLADEGCLVPRAVIERAHALQMLIFTAFSAFLVDGLLEATGTEPGSPYETLIAVAYERAELIRFVLDLVDRTDGPHPLS